MIEKDPFQLNFLIIDLMFRLFYNSHVHFNINFHLIKSILMIFVNFPPKFKVVQMRFKFVMLNSFIGVITVFITVIIVYFKRFMCQFNFHFKYQFKNQFKSLIKLIIFQILVNQLMWLLNLNFNSFTIIFTHKLIFLGVLC